MERIEPLVQEFFLLKKVYIIDITTKSIGEGYPIRQIYKNEVLTTTAADAYGGDRADVVLVTFAQGRSRKY